MSVHLSSCARRASSIAKSWAEIRPGVAGGTAAAAGLESAGAFALATRFFGFSGMGAADGLARCGGLFDAGFVAAFEDDRDAALDAVLELAFFEPVSLGLGLPGLATAELLAPVLALAGFLTPGDAFDAGREAALGAAFAGFLGVTFFRWAMRLEE